MSRTTYALVALHILVAGLAVGALAGHRLGMHVGEGRTIVCTKWCQRVAGREFGASDIDSDCACYGDVRALVQELDHARTDTEWPYPPPVRGTP